MSKWVSGLLMVKKGFWHHFDNPPPPLPLVDTGKNNEKKFFSFFFTMSRCHKKIVKNSIFASFQGDLACSWPEKKQEIHF